MRHRPAGAAREARWRAGVDVGGTWLRILAAGPSGRRRRLTRPAAGWDALPRLVAAAWRAWGLAPTDVAALVVSTRGVWTATEQRAAVRRLAPLARRVRVIPDAHAAHHAAFGGGSGLLILAGTGSIAVGRGARGGLVRAGGLGPLVGDEGSAFWIGREWLRARLARGGGGREFVATHRLLTAPDAVRRIAALAPVVLRKARRGDRTARRIAAAAQAELAALLLALLRRLRLRPPVPVSWAGRVLADPRFRAGVWRAARRRGLRLCPRPPEITAVEAALRLAGAAARAGTAPGRQRG